MVKYFAMAAAIIGSLAVADLAQARGPYGCASCSAAVYSGGCPGGVCGVTAAAPAPVAVHYSAPPTYVTAVTPAPTPAVAVRTVQPAPRYYATNYVRRGLFGWRR